MVPIKFCDLQCTNETALLREEQRDTEGCLEVSELLKTLFSKCYPSAIYILLWPKMEVR